MSIKEDRLEYRAGCGMKMPEQCKQAYYQYWIDIVDPPGIEKISGIWKRNPKVEWKHQGIL